MRPRTLAIVPRLTRQPTKRIKELLRQTDAVAEVHNTVRAGTAVPATAMERGLTWLQTFDGDEHVEIAGALFPERDQRLILR